MSRGMGTQIELVAQVRREDGMYGQRCLATPAYSPPVRRWMT